MSDSVLVAITVAIPPTLVGIAALWKVMSVHKKVANVHKELNSRLSEWKAETAKATLASNAAARAEGVKEGREKEKSKHKGNT